MMDTELLKNSLKELRKIAQQLWDSPYTGNNLAWAMHCIKEAIFHIQATIDKIERS